MPMVLEALVLGILNQVGKLIRVDLMSCSPVVKNLSRLGFQFYLDRSNSGV